MSDSFDLPPLYDPVTKEPKLLLNDIWADFWGRFFDILSSYISQNGVVLPSLTTVQRDQIKSPKNGQSIYNTTINSAQYWKNGAWHSY